MYWHNISCNNCVKGMSKGSFSIRLPAKDRGAIVLFPDKY